MIKWAIGEGKYEVINQFTFPGGEVGVSLIGVEEPDTEVTDITVHATLQDAKDIMALLMTTDAVRRQYPLANLTLRMPYVPYARQDRVCNVGEALSIKVFTNLINSLNFNLVLIADPHSIVTPALLNNCYVTNQYDIFANVIPDLRNTFIVAPDQGALKKVEDFAKRTGAKGIVSFTKHRDLATGKITGIALNTGSEIYPGQKYLVLDDICDGGRTFLELVPFFDGAERLDLAVTHGIFSKGVKLLTDMYDTVYTTDSFPQEPHERLIVKEL